MPKLAPRLAQMVDGVRKQDPPTMKKIPVESDIPEFLVRAGQAADATERARAVGDWSLIDFCYLLRIREYTRKSLRNANKQTKQFKLSDAIFFERGNDGSLRRLGRDAADERVLPAAGAMLNFDNQKQRSEGGLRPSRSKW